MDRVSEIPNPTAGVGTLGLPGCFAATRLLEYWEGRKNILDPERRIRFRFGPRRIHQKIVGNEMAGTTNGLVQAILPDLT